MATSTLGDIAYLADFALGSNIGLAYLTNIISATLTFIFYALEGSIIVQDLEFSLGIPLWLSFAITIDGHPISYLRDEGIGKIPDLYDTDVVSINGYSDSIPGYQKP